MYLLNKTVHSYFIIKTYIQYTQFYKHIPNKLISNTKETMFSI